MAYLALRCLKAPRAYLITSAQASQPQESQIAYLRQGNIYLFDPTTKHTTQLNNDDNVVASIACPPNGRRLAYEAMDPMVGVGERGGSLLINSYITTMNPTE